MKQVLKLKKRLSKIVEFALIGLQTHFEAVISMDTFFSFLITPLVKTIY